MATNVGKNTARKYTLYLSTNSMIQHWWTNLYIILLMLLGSHWSSSSSLRFLLLRLFIILSFIMLIMFFIFCRHLIDLAILRLLLWLKLMILRRLTNSKLSTIKYDYIYYFILLLLLFYYIILLFFAFIMQTT